MKFRIREYLKENPGAIFILASLALLLTATTLMAENQNLVNEIAIYSYYSLVVGVILQFAAFLRERVGV